MKKVAITQPYLFPYLPYFQIMDAVDQYVMYDDVQFITRGWINRNNLLVNGEAKRFTIALSGASANKLINEVDVFDDFEAFRKTLGFNYAKAPYLQQTLAVIDEICAYEDRNLARFISHSFDCLAEYMHIETPRVFSSSIDKDNGRHAQDKIIDISKRLQASTYINTVGGTDLYDIQAFKQHDLELKFLQSNPIVYKQFNNEFVPNLSIIDVMMFNDRDEIKKLLQEYELV